MKPATRIASVLLSVVAVAHLLRILFGVQVTVADAFIPMWVSVIAFVVAGAVAILLWREAGRKG